MYSSPGTPGGTGWRPASSTYTRVLAIGRPIGGAPAAPRVSSAAVDQIVVSVGPYTLVTDGDPAVRASASSAGSASPPTSTRTRASTSGAPSATPRHRLGVACTTVTPSASTTRRSSSGSCTSSLSASTTAAPLISGTNSSRCAMSNPTVVTASSRSSGVIAVRSRMSSTKLRRLPRVTTTPLGLPVEPEV